MAGVIQCHPLGGLTNFMLKFLGEFLGVLFGAFFGLVIIHVYQHPPTGCV